MSQSDETEQEALFYIEGPDEDGCVWIYGASTGDPWAQNLGPADKVAEVLAQWLGELPGDGQRQSRRGRMEAWTPMSRVWIKRKRQRKARSTWMR